MSVAWSRFNPLRRETVLHNYIISILRVQKASSTPFSGDQLKQLKKWMLRHF